MPSGLPAAPAADQEVAAAAAASSDDIWSVPLPESSDDDEGEVQEKRNAAKGPADTGALFLKQPLLAFGNPISNVPLPSEKHASPAAAAAAGWTAGDENAAAALLLLLPEAPTAGLWGATTRSAIMSAFTFGAAASTIADEAGNTAAPANVAAAAPAASAFSGGGLCGAAAAAPTCGLFSQARFAASSDGMFGAAAPSVSGIFGGGGGGGCYEHPLVVPAPQAAMFVPHCTISEVQVPPSPAPVRRQRKQQQQHCRLKSIAGCTLPFRKVQPPSKGIIRGEVNTRGKNGGWTRQK